MTQRPLGSDRAIAFGPVHGEFEPQQPGYADIFEAGVKIIHRADRFHGIPDCVAARRPFAV